MNEQNTARRCIYRGCTEGAPVDGLCPEHRERTAQILATLKRPWRQCVGCGRDISLLHGRVIRCDECKKLAEAVRARKQRRGKLWQFQTKFALAIRQGGCCTLCHARLPEDFKGVSVDHIIALAHWPNVEAADYPGNLQLLCNSCNSKKHAHTVYTEIATRKQTILTKEETA